MASCSDQKTCEINNTTSDTNTNPDNITNPNNITNTTPLSSDIFPNLLANSETTQKFCAIYEDGLSTLADSFPECNLTKNALQTYLTTIKISEKLQTDLIQHWHQEMLPLYAEADKHDNTNFWNVVPLFRDINIASKVSDPEFGSESVNVLWEFIDLMNRQSRIYNAIPANVYSKIQTKSLEYKSKIESGELKLDMNNINIPQLLQIGQDFLSSFDHRDMHEVTSNISGLAQSFGVRDMSDAMKMFKDMPGLENTFDPASVMQIINSFAQQQPQQQSQQPHSSFQSK
jgi:hypothetical protein